MLWLLATALQCFLKYKTASAYQGGSVPWDRGFSVAQATAFPQSVTPEGVRGVVARLRERDPPGGGLGSSSDRG